MKKTILLLAFILVFFSSAFAKFVDVQTAQKIALAYYKFNSNVATVTASLIYTRTETDNIVDFYVFNINPKGFVIVSADDNASPILAFSSEITFKVNMPDMGILNWMNNAAMQVHYIVKNNLPADEEITSEWTAYTNGRNPVDSRSATSVSPLLSTIWNQTTYYDHDCPAGCVTGCVATAMGQIMKYWNYPYKGTGSYSYANNAFSANFGNTIYHWSVMPDSLTALSTDTQVDVVAQLLYQVGVSVAMAYQGFLGSSAWVLQSDNAGSPCSQSAFVGYFGYNPTTIQGLIKSDFTSTQWTNLIKAELSAGRPVQYAGSDSVAGGHSWVCDGYNSSGLFHMNWGWGGQYDGYFTLAKLNPSGYDFKIDDEALIGIEPEKSSGDTETTTTGILNTISATDLENIAVYPVPASSAVTVKYNGSQVLAATVSVINILGQTLATYTSVNLNDNYQLDISKYAAGFYFLTVSTADGNNRKMIKFIKQ